MDNTRPTSFKSIGVCFKLREIFGCIMDKPYIIK